MCVMQDGCSGNRQCGNLQASAVARKYAGEAYLRYMMLAAVEIHP